MNDFNRITRTELPSTYYLFFPDARQILYDYE